MTDVAEFDADSIPRSARNMDIDTSVPQLPRFAWPKAVPDLSPDQKLISDDFMKYWHEVLPSNYPVVEKFNHRYPLRTLSEQTGAKTLEIGAGIGEHLEYEPVEKLDYHCVELRPAMAEEIRKRFPAATVVTGDCQTRLPYPDESFDRVIVIHVLEHLPDLPGALAEIRRVLKPTGSLSIVIPCDPGFAYELARKISAERLFHKRYGIPYRWLIRREHINSPAEVMSEVRKNFDVADTTYFPLAVPIVDLNLCIGVTAKKRPADAVTAAQPTGGRLWSEFLRLVRFGMVGMLSTAAYAGVALLLHTVFSYPPLVAAAIGNVAAIGISYFGHLFFSFQVKPDHGLYLKRFVALAIATFVLNIAITYLVAHVLGWPGWAAIAVVVALVPLTSYLLSRFWVFLPGLRN